MCGISGIYGHPLPSDAGVIVQKMNDSIAHRGPDDAGIYTDENVALGHRRLAILDLSPAGHQPMFDASGKIAIVYNGEIYNFLEIRSLLSDYTFKTQSDTEVILAAYLKWGVECLKTFQWNVCVCIMGS